MSGPLAIARLHTVWSKPIQAGRLRYIPRKRYSKPFRNVEGVYPGSICCSFSQSGGCRHGSRSLVQSPGAAGGRERAGRGCGGACLPCADEEPAALRLYRRLRLSRTRTPHRSLQHLHARGARRLRQHVPGRTVSARPVLQCGARAEARRVAHAGAGARPVLLERIFPQLLYPDRAGRRSRLLRHARQRHHGRSVADAAEQSGCFPLPNSLC